MLVETSRTARREGELWFRVGLENGQGRSARGGRKRSWEGLAIGEDEGGGDS